MNINHFVNIKFTIRLTGHNVFSSKDGTDKLLDRNKRC